MEETLRVLVVDDSALYRALVRNVLREVPGVEVVATSKCGTEALAHVTEIHPDLMTLDVQMPDINGIDVLRALKREQAKTRAIMLSSLTADGAQTTTDALFEGAFDFIHKPSGSDAILNRRVLLHELTEKIAAFRSSRPAPRKATSAAGSPPVRKPSIDDSEAPSSSDKPSPAYEAIVIGTSTGGPVALKELVPGFPKTIGVPIFIVQHMPAQYTFSLAQRLNECSEIRVLEGAEGMPVELGTAYLAPGGFHMKIERRVGKSVISITEDPHENRCRPAVDYLFRSAAEVYRGRIVAAVMTGMGRDGTEGCRAIKKAGGYVFTQSPEGCVVYGMPKAVVEERLSDRSLQLERLAAAITKRVLRSRES